MSEETKIIRKYSNGEITIVWKPDQCIHSKHCWQELPEVFDPDKRPWVNPCGTSTAHIIAQIKRCPTNAISYYANEKKEEQQTPTQTEAGTTIPVQALVNGPLLVTGNLSVTYQNLEPDLHCGVTAFCRCGASQNRPYCDGSHEKIHFKG